jgi:hypothetical protein
MKRREGQRQVVAKVSRAPSPTLLELGVVVQRRNDEVGDLEPYSISSYGATMIATVQSADGNGSSSVMF